MSRSGRASTRGDRVRRLLLYASVALITACASASAAPLPAPQGQQAFNSVAEVSDRSRPAVVFIAVGTTPPQGAFGAQPQGAVGSGAIIDARGFIVTNNHVVENAQSIRVVLPDNRTYDAKLVGRDPPSDLAVIKIDPKAGETLPVLKFGDSSALKVGEWVVAIGNALGLEGGPTVTAGVVSALGRDVDEPNGATLENVVQTDAAINPGNSGGPLLNMAGEIVGINTLGAGTVQPGYQAQGINFAIASQTAKPIVDDLINNGKVVRAFLGVSSVTFTPALAARVNIPFVAGAIIADVGDGTPAGQAGLKQGDVIVGFDNQEVKTDRDLRSAIYAHKPGDEVTIKYVRGGGQPQTARIKLGERPAA